MAGQVYYDKATGQYYTTSYDPQYGISTPGMLKRVYLNAPASAQQSTQLPAFQRQPFTSNAMTQAQLQGVGNGQAPQWMMDAYARKIGQMGGNANPPVPFGVTPSGFPGMGGKTAPTQGQ